MLGERSGGGLPEGGGAESIKKPPQGGALGAFDCAEHVLSALFAHPFDGEQFFHVEVVEIGVIFHQPSRDELFAQLFAKPIDVHRSARGEVADVPLQLSRAGKAGTAGDRPVLLADGPSAAKRARAWKVELPFLPRPSGGYHLDDFRNDVARPANKNPIADAHVLAPEFVLVVQRRSGHGYAADSDGS